MQSDCHAGFAPINDCAKISGPLSFGSVREVPHPLTLDMLVYFPENHRAIQAFPHVIMAVQEDCEVRPLDSDMSQLRVHSNLRN